MTSPIRLTFWGAAGQVTGSMHLLEAAGARVLLDAGLFQGHRVDTRKLNAELPFDARRIDSIIVSHAHIDHTGRLPLLANEGFHGPIIATPATRDLCAVMLADAAHIQEKDFDFLGHILGSASVDLRITEGGSHRLVFSGDIGRGGLPIIRDPEPPAGPIDTLIIESTYAERDHESIAGSEERLGEAIRRTAARGGKVLVPAFAVGRVQELVYSINQLFRDGKIPKIPVFVDSPLAVEVTSVFRLHPETFDRSEVLVESGAPIFDVPLLQYVRDVQDSKSLNRLAGPAVIIAASGMAENGRILHHLANNIGDHRSLVLFVGFQADGTLGRRIQDGAKMVKIFGEMHEMRAETETIGGYSAHADRTELRAWVRQIGAPVRRAFCVHGEPSALQTMAGILREEGVREVHVPAHGESFELS